MANIEIKHLILILSILLPFQVYSDTLHISAEQSGAFECAEYVIEKTVIVPEDEKLKFLPGSKLLFNPYAGMNVSGDLVCEGTKENPIIFTSISNTTDSLSKNYLQWHGIIVNKTGKISFKHCQINNSLYGIKVPDTSSMFLFDSVSFYQNDNQLILGEVPVFSGDSTNFSFPIPEKRVPLTRIPFPSEVYKKRKSPLFPILHSTFIACSIGGAVAWGYFKSKADYYQDEYQKLGKGEEAAMADYKDRRDRYITYYRTGLTCTLISLSASIVTITINIKSHRKDK